MTAPRALLTGGAGFIGAHLADRLLAEDWSVVIVDDLSRGIRDPHLERIAGHPAVSVLQSDVRDLRAEDLGGEVTHVVHLAAVVGVQNVLDDPERVLRNNVESLHSVLDLARRQPAFERLVFPSTSEVYAGTLAEFGISFPTPEDVPLTVTPLDQPRTSYMLSKIYGEALVRQSDLPSVVVRPHNVYGPRMGTSHVVPQLLERLARAGGGDVVVHSPDHRRTFCYIDDAVEYLVALMVEPRAVGATVNLGVQDPEVTMRDLALLLRDVSGADAQLVDGDEHPGSPSRRQPDTSLLRRLTGREPAVSLEDGLSRTWAWYRDQGLT